MSCAVAERQRPLRYWQYVGDVGCFVRVVPWKCYPWIEFLKLFFDWIVGDRVCLATAMRCVAQLLLLSSIFWQFRKSCHFQYAVVILYAHRILLCIEVGRPREALLENILTPYFMVCSFI